jgi:hypothetical protein
MIDRFDEMITILNEFKTQGIRTPLAAEVIADSNKKSAKKHASMNLERVITFQDIVGRSTKEEIWDAWEKLDEFQRSLFIWAISCCLSYDTICSVMNETVGRDAKRKILRQLNVEYEKLAQQEIEIGNRLNEVKKKEKEVAKIIEAQKQIQLILNGIHG